MSKFKLLMLAFLTIGCGVSTNSVVMGQPINPSLAIVSFSGQTFYEEREARKTTSTTKPLSAPHVTPVSKRTTTFGATQRRVSISRTPPPQHATRPTSHR